LLSRLALLTRSNRRFNPVGRFGFDNGVNQVRRQTNPSRCCFDLAIIEAGAGISDDTKRERENDD
jgi:hypothetical protein